MVRRTANWEAFFELSLDMLCIASFDGQFKVLNPVWEHVLGWSIEEMLATPWLDFVHPDDLQATRDQGTKVRAGGRSFCFENRYRCKDGGYKWVQWTSAPDPAASLIYCVARDVTQERQTRDTLQMQAEELTRREEMFKDLFNAAPDAILVVGDDGTILLANSEAERSFRYEPGAMAGLSEEALLPSASRQRHAGLRKDYFVKPLVRRMGRGLDMRAMRRDGSEFPVDIALGPFPFRGRPAALAVVRDITEQRSLEAQFRQSQKMEAIGSLAGGRGPRLQQHLVGDHQLQLDARR